MAHFDATNHTRFKAISSTFIQSSNLLLELVLKILCTLSCGYTTTLLVVPSQYSVVPVP